MKSKKGKTNRTRKGTQPAPKKSEVVVLKIDEDIEGVLQIQAEENALKERKDKLKGRIKTAMAELGVTKYETLDGHKAQFIESQRPKYDAEKIRKLLGEDFASVVKYNTVKSFKVS